MNETIFNTKVSIATTKGMDALLFPPETRRAMNGAREFVKALIGNRGANKEIATLVVQAAKEADRKNNYWRGFASMEANVRRIFQMEGAK